MSLKSDEEVLDFIRTRGGGVSFVEIEEFHGKENCRGPIGMCFPEAENVFTWMGVNQAFIDQMRRLKTSLRVIFWPTSYLTYLVDGVYVEMPLAKKLRNYKTPHWVPTVLFLPDQLNDNQRKMFRKLHGREPGPPAAGGAA